MARASPPSLAEIWRWLAAVPDPEVPVVSVTELGIVRDVALEGETVVVAITPTYSGCPAASVIALDVEAALRGQGVEHLRIERRLAPPWTTDWISAEGREKLRRYGIAPPVDGTAALDRAPGRAAEASRNKAAALLQGGAVAVACPRCGAQDTEKVSQFGSTPCKAHYRCRACLEPFDYFKCI